jgi:plastocyanin
MIVRQLSSAALLIAAALFACSAESGKTANTTVKTVLIDHFKYQPDTLTVNVGDTVEWKNVDIVPHTVTAADRKSFDSGGIANGASWRFTPCKRGTYGYFCTLHPNMKAKLIVQ